MSHDVQIDELLSAYLTGDITPAERVAVEQRLATDSALRQQLADLQALMGLLAQAHRPVTAKMLSDLKRRMEHSGTPQTADLLAAAMTGDVTPAERAAVDQLVSQDGHARRELASLQAMSSFLKKAELPISKNVGRSLVDRLSAKLPAAALSPVLPSADETVAIKLQTSAPTVRIYAMQESPWRKRMLKAAAAIAAAILFAAGAIFGLRALKPETDVAKESAPVRKAPEVQPPTTENGPRENSHSDPRSVEMPDGTSTPGMTDQNAVNPPAPPPSVQNSGQEVTPAPKAHSPQTPTPHLNVPVAPKTSPRNPSAAPKHLPTPDNSKPVESAPEIAPEPQHGPNPEPALEPDQKTVVENVPKTGGLPLVQSNGTVVPGTIPDVALNTNPKTATVPQSQNPTQPPTPTPDPVPPVNNSFIAAVDGKLVAAVLRDGNDAAATTPDGVQTIQLKNELPSNSTITTGNARIAFVLPGDGRLWINRHSKVTVQLDGPNTVMTLQSGEISYRAPHTGNGTVNSGSLQAYTTGLMDVALDDAQGLMTAYSFDGSTRLTRKGKSTINLNKQRNEVIAKADLSDTPAAQSGPAAVLLWQQDLNVNGETDGLVTTSKKDDKSSRSRSRK